MHIVGCKMRTKTNINNKWMFIQKNVELNELLKQKAKKVNIPHTWNNLDGQDGGSDYYRGTCWYYKKLGKISLEEFEQLYIEFHGVNSICDVYLNNTHLIHHEGGFSTFRARIDKVMNDENILAVKVDNSANDYIYPQFADFTFFGGIYRDVNLIKVNKTHFDLEYYGSEGIKVTPKVDGTTCHVKVQNYVMNYTNQSISYFLLDNNDEVVKEGKSSSLEFDFDIENVHLWDGIENPYLYTIVLNLVENGKIIDSNEVKFGARSFRIDPNEGFFLNGRSYPLRGVSRHQDRLNKGWAISKQDHLEDMKLISELGANTIRLAHYQHDPYFYDLCDQFGMVVWAEIPFISIPLPNGYDNTISQMKELVIQNYNHPSIVVWGLSNEITMNGESEELIKNHQDLNDLVHSIDKTRLTTMAQVSMLDQNSPMNAISDVLSYNHYFGWYGGECEDNAVWCDEFHAMHPDKCFGISEYGCEGILKWHTSNPESGDYSEEYQAHYHHVLLETFATRPYLWATHVWNMFDFAADNRDEGGCKGRNNKGLVTYDRKTKKDSYYLYQAYWSKKPMLHLAKKRYLYRCEEETEVLVYSNQPHVSLYVNGKLQETISGNHVFRFIVKLDKSTTKLTVKSGCLVDKSVIKKVSKPYMKYSLDGVSGGVANWFDENGHEKSSTINREYFSIKDKIKEIQANPEANKVLEEFMAKMMQGMEGKMEIPEGAMKMMGGFSIDRIAKMLKDKIPTGVIEEINKALQQIKK